jgi:hypothetical protein
MVVRGIGLNLQMQILPTNAKIQNYKSSGMHRRVITGEGSTWLIN